MRATARYYRDRAGRVRIEQELVGHAGPPRVMLVPDTHGAEAYLLNPVDRTTGLIPRGLVQMMIGGGGNNNFILPLTGARFMSFFQVPTTNLTSSEESLRPRADLFAAPADYEVTTAKYPFTWAGPKRMLELMEEGISRR